VDKNWIINIDPGTETYLGDTHEGIEEA